MVAASASRMLAECEHEVGKEDAKSFITMSSNLLAMASNLYNFRGKRKGRAQKEFRRNLFY